MSANCDAVLLRLASELKAEKNRTADLCIELASEKKINDEIERRSRGIF